MVAGCGTSDVDAWVPAPGVVGEVIGVESGQVLGYETCDAVDVVGIDVDVG